MKHPSKVITQAVSTLLVLAGCHCPSPSPRHAAPPDAAESTCDFLYPRAAPVTSPGYSAFPEHEVAVAKTLFARLDALHPAEKIFLVMMKDKIPVPEEAVYVLAPAPSPVPSTHFRVVHVRAKQRIPDDRSVEAELSEAFLDKLAVLALERVWSKMTGTARWQSREEVIRLDPAQYLANPVPEFNFEYWGPHVFSQGETLLLDPTTCSAALASIGELLMRFADEPDASRRAALREELMRHIEQLARRLRIQHSNVCDRSPCLSAR
jgi:hypothetical protein